jgi:hypothetical protein
VVERLYRVVQRQATRRVPGPGDLLHAGRGQDLDRTLAPGVQHVQAAQRLGLPASGTRGGTGRAAPGSRTSPRWVTAHSPLPSASGVSSAVCRARCAGAVARRRRCPRPHGEAAQVTPANHARTVKRGRVSIEPSSYGD